ncbi:MAG: RHS repeat-associated core domain-containing protein [Candidatus Roizmanbacteria bacterium]
MQIKGTIIIIIIFISYFLFFRSSFAHELTVKRVYLPVSENITIVRENTGTMLLVNNYLSSTSLEIDDRKNIKTQSYYPDGTSLLKKDLDTDKQFTGYRNLDSLSIYNAGARFYQPILAQFVQPDQKEGPNRYIYSHNSPIEFNDPTGNSAVSVITERVREWLSSMIDREGSQQYIADREGFIKYSASGPDPIYPLLTPRTKAEIASGIQTPVMKGFYQINNTFRQGGAYGGVVSVDLNRDRALRYFLETQAGIIAERRRRNPSLSRVDLAVEAVSNIVLYSKEGERAVFAMGRGGVQLGDFIDARAGVCLEQAVCTHLLLARLGKESVVVRGKSDPMTNTGHAWVEVIDSNSSLVRLADPAKKFVANRTLGGRTYSRWDGMSETSYRHTILWRPKMSQY